MSPLSRRSVCAAGSCVLLNVAAAPVARRLVLQGGHRRVGDKLIVRGSLVQGMVAISVMVGTRGPFLFEVATVGGLAVRHEAAAIMGLKPGSDGTAHLAPGRVADFQLAWTAPARVLPEGHGLARPLDGVLGLDAFGEMSLALDFSSGDLLVGPVGLGEPDGRTIFGYEVYDAPVVPVSIGRTTFPARISTGQIRAPLLINPALAPKLAASQPVFEGEAFDGNRRFELRRITLIERARVGDTRLPVSSAVYPGPSEENSLGALGLAGLILQLDRKNRRVRIASKG